MAKIWNELFWVMTPCSLTQGYQLSEEVAISILSTEVTSEVTQNVSNHLQKNYMT